MNIRAHHLLCMRYFQGKGYSKKFVSNFYGVIKKLESDPVINIVDYPDVICKACPHLKNDKCMKRLDSEEKVKKKDEEIMDILGLKPNQKIKAEATKKLVEEKLESLRKTCKDCEWKKFC